MNTLQTEPRRGDWMQTYSGVAFYPLDPRPEEVRLEDIAHALSLICRYNGHADVFFSVAQHSVIVSHNVPPEWALQGLMHDAAEAYVGDKIKPIKACIPALEDMEAKVREAVFDKFNLPLPIHTSVHEADVRCLLAEKKCLRMAAKAPMPWGVENLGLEPLPIQIVALQPQVAEMLFIERFQELTQIAAEQNSLPN